MADQQTLKQEAAQAALEWVKDDMVLGLGGGSTAALMIRSLGRALAEGKMRNVRGVPCGEAVAVVAREAGVPLVDWDEVAAIDLTIDGADEVDLSTLHLIKGGGGALTREKIVAQHSRQELIIVDESKCVEPLGEFPLPVEVTPFGWQASERYLKELGARRVWLRETEDGPFLTDQGLYILDADFERIADPYALAAALEARAGIVEHGLFLDLADAVIVASNDGVRTYTVD